MTSESVFPARKYWYGEKILEALPGLGGSWITGWRSDAGGTHRLKSKFLPVRWSRDEAQRDLDAWAKLKGLGVAPWGT